MRQKKADTAIELVVVVWSRRTLDIAIWRSKNRSHNKSPLVEGEELRGQRELKMLTERYELRSRGRKKKSDADTTNQPGGEALLWDRRPNKTVSVPFARKLLGRKVVKKTGAKQKRKWRFSLGEKKQEPGAWKLAILKDMLGKAICCFVLSPKIIKKPVLKRPSLLTITITSVHDRKPVIPKGKRGQQTGSWRNWPHA